MWTYNQTPDADELVHYGVLGMKWGVRRSKAQLARARKKSAKREPDHEDYTKAHTPKSIRQMSDNELNSRNKRLNAEKQYRNLTQKTGRGKKIVNAIVGTSQTITALTGAYLVYKKVGSQVLDKVGDYVIGDIKIGKITN